MSGTLYALASGLCFAGLDSIRKHLLARLDSWSLLFLLSVGQAASYAIWLLLDPGFQVLSSLEWSRYVGPLGLVAVLQIGANLLFLEALHVGDLSRIVPFLSLTPVMTGLGARLALQQQPTAAEWTGIVLVTVGTVLVAAVRSAGQTWRLDRASVMTMGVAALWSSAAAVDQHALAIVPPSVHALMQSAVMAVLVGLSLSARGRLAAALHDVRAVALVFGSAVALGALALGFQLVAMQTVLVSLVETIKRASGSVASLIVGRTFFDERITGLHVLGVSSILVGTALVLLPPALLWS